VSKKQAKLKSEGLDPPLIECCDFCDKREIIYKCLNLEREFLSELKKIEKLRNSIAHAATYITSNTEYHDFIWKLDMTFKWIVELSNTHTLELVPQLPKEGISDD
jgi:hypothetical protein